MSKLPHLCACLALCAAAGFVWATAKPDAKPKLTTAPPGPSLPAAGLRVHLDPATGRMVPPPARAAVDLPAKAMFPSSHEGLVEVPGTTAAGGFKVETRGQFRSAVMLRIGPDGKPVMNCVEGTSAQSTSR